MKKLSLAILISGNGSNLQAIIDAIAYGKLNAQIKVVISDKAEAYGLERAQQAEITTEIISSKQFANREEFDTQLLSILKKYHPDLIILAGFMRILTPIVTSTYAGRMLNIHPALLPKHRGLHTHEKALAAGDKEHGMTIHFVTSDLDAGPIIAQAKLTVNANDTADSLKQRTLVLEHQIYPRVIQWFVDHRVKLEGDRVFLDGQLLPKTGYLLN